MQNDEQRRAQSEFEKARDRFSDLPTLPRLGKSDMRMLRRELGVLDSRDS